MVSCEKCWGEAGGDVKYYLKLLSIHDHTAEEQAGGKYALICQVCGKQTVHMHAKKCLSCGNDAEEGERRDG